MEKEGSWVIHLLTLIQHILIIGANILVKDIKLELVARKHQTNQVNKHPTRQKLAEAQQC